MQRVALAVIATLAVLGGCGPTDANGDGIADGVNSPDNVSLVAPSTPVGTISGVVLDTRLRPLADVTATLSIGTPTADGAKRTATSNADGDFSFTGIPAGSDVFVTLTKQGFATVRSRTSVPAAAGDFPINNANGIVGPFAMTQLNGTMTLLVVTHTGRPAKGAKAIVEATPAGVRVSEFGGYGTNVGVVVVDAPPADDSGLITVTGIPSGEELNRLQGRYNISIAPIDENGDGIFDSAGTFVTYTGTNIMLDPSPRVVELPDARQTGALQLLATNVPSLTGFTPPTENMVKSGEAIYLVFNQAVQPDSVLAVLTDEEGKADLGVAVTVGKTGNVVQLQPAVALENGREYNLSVRTTSSDTGSFFSGIGYLFAADPFAPVEEALKSIQYRDQSPAEGLLSPFETVYVNFTVPLGQAIGTGGLEAFINYDINASGSIGDAPGETGSKSGFGVFPSEPNGLPDGNFALKPSGYTSRWQFTYVGTVTVPPQIMVRVAFDKVADPAADYQTIWGEPVTSAMSAGLTIAQP